MSARAPRIARGVYRLLLCLFPTAARRRDGDEMEAMFIAQLHRTRGTGRLLYLIRVVVDGVWHGLGERLELLANADRRAVWRAITNMWSHDLRHACRLLARQPGAIATIVLTLALGIGANTAVFSLVHAVLLRPLPYPAPEQLVALWEKRPAEGVFNNVVSPADYLDWVRLQRSLTAIAAYAGGTADLTGVGDPVQLPMASVSAPFFELFGVRALHGRTLSAGDDVFGRHRVLVIGHALWQQRFGGDPRAVGRLVDVNGVAHEIVGVLPRDFEFPGATADLWLPLVLQTGAEAPPRAAHFLNVYGRLAPGATLESARAEMDRIGQDLERAYPNESRGHGAHVTSLGDEIVGPARRGLLVTMAAVAFLLLIACTNVAHVLLARGTQRRREMAIRAAVGAGRGRLLRQTFVESLVVTALGGVAGLVLATWAIDLLIAETPPALAAVGLERARLNVPVLLFTAAVCLLTALVAGLLPSWQIARTSPADPLRDGGRSPGSLKRGVRIALVASEVAMTVLLLVGAGLMLRSFVRALSQPPGIAVADRLTVSLTLPRSRYPDAEALRRARRELDDRLNAIPGVVAAGANNNLPFSGSDSRRGITVEGYERGADEPPVRAHTRIVTPRYFAAAGIAVQSGRGFTADDRAEAAPVVVINDTMARRYWRGRNPVGQRVRFNNPGEPWREVVGVIPDVRHWGLDREVNPELYMPYEQQPSASLMYVVHVAAGDPVALVPAVTTAVQSLDPQLPLGAVNTMEGASARSLAPRRWSAILFGLFALVALMLAAAGIYGVMAHLVSMRTAEIGIRMTLGAHPGAVLRQMLGEALQQAAAGLAVGLALALLLMRGLNALLFEITPADPVVFAAAAVLVLSLAVAAALVPARRAMRVDPVAALRN